MMKQEPVTVRMTQLAHRIHRDTEETPKSMKLKAQVRIAADLHTNKLDAFQASTVLAICCNMTKERALDLIVRSRTGRR